MNRMKSWTMSMTSWVDGVLAQVENHEAAVSSAIARVRRSTAQARVQLRRVEKDEDALRDSLTKEEEAVLTWKRRAKTADHDEKAIECLRRHKASERRVIVLRRRLTEQERARKELGDGIRALNGRLGELKERKHVMNARQSRAEAAHGMTSATGPIGDLEDLFDRWDSRVGEMEIAVDCGDPIDGFESTIDSEEETASLQAELAELRAGRD